MVLGGQGVGIVADLFQQFLQYRVQAAGADVFGAFVDLPGHFSNAPDAVVSNLQVESFGIQQGLVLLSEGASGFGENALEVIRGQGAQFHADGQTALQLRDQIAGLGQVKGAGGDKQDVVSLDHAVLGGHGAAFDQRQQVSLYPFTGHISAAAFTTLGHLVDFIQEDDAVVFHCIDGLHLEFVLIDEARGFLVPDQPVGFADTQLLAALAAAPAHFREHLLQLAGHFFHAGRGHDFHPGRIAGHLDLDFLVVQLALAELLAEDLASAVVRLALFVAAGRGQQGVEDAFFGGIIRLAAHAGDGFLAQHLDGHFHQVADDGFHIAAHIAHFGELGGFDLDEGSVGQLGQAAGNFGLAHAGGADHEDVLGGHFGTHFCRQLHAPPAIAQGQGNGFFRRLLADNVLVQFMNNFARGQVWHRITSSILQWFAVDWCRRRYRRRWSGSFRQYPRQPTRCYAAGRWRLPGQRGRRSRWRSGHFPAQ